MKQIRGPESRDSEPVAIPTTHEARVLIGREPGRHAERVGIVGLGLVLLAFLKPWTLVSGPEPSRPPPPPRAGVVITAAPIEAKACIGQWWSIEVDEESGGPVARAWVLTHAVEAMGPLDTRIRFVTVAAREVVGLGICPPSNDAPIGASATFFRLDPTPRAFGTTSVLMAPEPEVPANTLYRPSATSGTGTPSPQASWPAGRYVIRVDGLDGYQRWLGVDVRVVAAAGAGASAPLD
jgi:hypothetical protein